MKLHQSETAIDDAVDIKQGADPIHNWFFNYKGENYAHKVVDFANARYQPTTVDIKDDPYYRAKTSHQIKTPKPTPEEPPTPIEAFSPPEEPPEDQASPREQFKQFTKQTTPPPKQNFPIAENKRQLFEKAFSNDQEKITDHADLNETNIPIQKENRQAFKKIFSPTKREIFKQAFAPTKPIAQNNTEGLRHD